ncbi:CDP-diacylglycerol diphosphatase [Serratia marcescens]|uniref:CDP-diacylglycerol diphosphatase n=1 Tax=Serratia marcescens TaxID=615 RepID=UPI00192BCC60|nr:CDP-diacylglycerol diphosphatase [Serratia marcescens]MBL5822252.1 CDP-diacylglycerol diphosphatase [Serratia marcescens]
MLLLRFFFKVSVLFLIAAPPSAFASNALWRVVNNLCVFNYQYLGTPFPCDKVSMDEGVARGYAIVRDLESRYHYLLVPTLKMAGVESPELLLADTPNYFALAWQNRHVLEEVYGSSLPREAYALTINSQRGRTQGQLHIHISCLKPHVRRSIDRQLPNIGDEWTPLKDNLVGQHYLGMRIRQADLDGVFPFINIGHDLIKKNADMRKFGVAVVPVTFEDKQQGFILLADEEGAMKNNTGHTENLLDFSCKNFTTHSS